MSEDRDVAIDAALVRQLLQSQFPQLATEPIRPVQPSGWDNRMFRLGADLVVRLPSADHYSAQLLKEQRWLPWLAPRLPLQVPEPVVVGQPTPEYPRPWAVYRWIEGETPAALDVGNARCLAHFHRRLRRLDPTAGPPAGEQTFYRGSGLDVYDAQVRSALSRLGPKSGSERLLAAWERACAEEWHGDPVWFHGDLTLGNLLVRNGELVAVLDFGLTGVGDPACDLAIAWSGMEPSARAVFFAEIDLDDATRARGRGWAIWKAVTVASGLVQTSDLEGARAECTIAQVVLDLEQDV